MAIRKLAPVVYYLKHLGGSPETLAPTDQELWGRFVHASDPCAFESLVQRHGPMVLGVCRRLLSDSDAEDAFQATFLLFLRKARHLRHPERLGPWLYGVARRTALKARALAEVRRQREQTLDDIPVVENNDLIWRDLRPLLDDAIAHLPGRYRIPFILCYLEGLTNAQAAQRLGCPTGTIATRLARAREQLRVRLTRRGVTLSVGALSAILSQRSVLALSLPPTLVPFTLHLTSPMTITPPVLALTEGVCRAMLIQRLRSAVLALMAVLTLGGGGAIVLNTLEAADDRPPLVQSRTTGAPAPTVRPPEEKIPGRTANFIVEAPNMRVARLIAEQAELHRRSLATRWLGKELPAWAEPCRVEVRLTDKNGAGVTTFEYATGKVKIQHMRLEGTLESILTTTLPHEVCHTILAHYFGKPLPRWADEGIAVLSEDRESTHIDETAREVLTANLHVPLRRLLALHDYTEGGGRATFHHGASLTQFLVGKKDRATLLTFVQDGDRVGWDRAVQSHYKYNTIEDLERAWLLYLGLGSWAPLKEPHPSREVIRRLPNGPAPSTVLAILDANEILTLRTARIILTPITLYEQDDTGPPRPKTHNAARREEIRRTFSTSEYKAYDRDGEPLTSKRLAERLRKETPVLLSSDGEPVDPFHLQLMKNDTIVLVLSQPLSPPQPPVSPVPVQP